MTSGKGAAGGHVQKVADLLKPLLGCDPYPGSLNLIMSDPRELAPHKALISVGGRHFWAATLNNRPCLIYRWGACPLHVVEIVACQNLRDELTLADGTQVDLESDSFQRLPRFRRRAWESIWKHRNLDVYNVVKGREPVSVSKLAERLARQTSPKSIYSILRFRK